jgi:hypothetical protein
LIFYGWLSISQTLYFQYCQSRRPLSNRTALSFLYKIRAQPGFCIFQLLRNYATTQFLPLTVGDLILAFHPLMVEDLDFVNIQDKNFSFATSW